MSYRPNILIVSVDSLRADRLGCYGYSKPTSPFIDSLAKEGILCENLICEGIPTEPSYTTFYSGQHPITHNIVAHGGTNNFSEKTPLLPELFLEAGYTTCAVDNLWRMKDWFGRGYEFYIDPSIRRTLLLCASCEELNSRAIPWLKSHASEPFFMFVHYWDTHWPYTPPERYHHLFYDGNPIDPENRSLEPYWRHPIGMIASGTWLRLPEGLITDVAYVAALYDQEIRYLDDGVQALLKTLDETGMAEQTIVVFTSDHGESLGEHNVFFEHYSLYDSVLRIPLIIRWSEHFLSGVRFPGMIPVKDLAPTLLDAAGIPVPSSMEGISRYKTFSGHEVMNSVERVISLESTFQANWSLRTNTHKLIVEPTQDLHARQKIECYDLSDDPQEKHNIAEEQPDLTEILHSELKAWIAGRLNALGKSKDPLIEHGVSIKFR